MRVLYTFSIRCYWLAIQIAALLGKHKAKQWVIGRKGWKNQLRGKIKNTSNLIWFHTASLGEFEQARPLIERIKKEHPQQFILLTFFSPSGYEIRKNYTHADCISYLPIDVTSNVQDFLSITKPQLAVFIKYEFWFNYLHQLKKQNVKTILVSGIFRPSQLFFKKYGGWFAKQLQTFDHFYLQNTTSQQLLSSIGLSNTTVCGDTRLDRVLALSQEPFHDDRITTFCNGKKTIIFGSSWEPEHDLAHSVFNDFSELKIILAPHEISPPKMLELHKKFGNNSILWSNTQTGQNLSGAKILIMDQIGLLSKLYRYGTFAFVGGGFGSGIHNTLEAAVYGLAVFFGPNYAKFQEAKDLLKAGAAKSVSSYSDLKDMLSILLTNEKDLAHASLAAKNYVQNSSGAVEKIYNALTIG